MAPSSGHEDRSERTETGSDRVKWCEEQEEAVHEWVAEFGKSLGLREVDSTERSRARRNTRSIRRESVGEEKGPETRGQKDTVIRKKSKRKVGKKKTRKKKKKTVQREEQACEYEWEEFENRTLNDFSKVIGVDLERVPWGRRDEFLMLYQCYYEQKLYRVRKRLIEKISIQRKNRVCKRIAFEVNRQRVGEALEEALRKRADRTKLAQRKEKERRENRGIVKVRKEFKKNRIRMCGIKRIGIYQWYESARNRAERDMRVFYPLQKDRREKEVDRYERQKKKRRNEERERAEKLERVVEETNYDYGENQRNDIIEIMIGTARKEQISWEINESMRGEESERGGRKRRLEWIEEDEGGGRQKRRARSMREKRQRQKLGGGLRGVVITCGWEKRRREMMERWEAPPPGPPGRRRRELN